MSTAAKAGFLTIRHLAGSGDEVMRLDTDGKLSLALYVGEPEEGDHPIEHDGEPLLYVGRMVSAAYDGCVVDLQETSDGACFVIGPP